MRSEAWLWVVLFLLGPGLGSAAAEIYRWTDERGQLHFTQQLDRVPRAHRQAAREAAERPDAPIPYQSFARTEPAQRPGRRGVIEIPFERHGSLMKVYAELNDGLRVPFYIDTGASGVSLPRGVAERLGIDVDSSTPTVFVRTANGLVERPVVRLDAVEIGGARVEGLMAIVNPSMEVGLLGGDFFNNFIYSVDAARAVISLTANDGIRGGFDAEAWRARFSDVRAPLARLEVYLSERDVTRPERRSELEQKREELRNQLADLEIEARRAGVPMEWRH